MYIITLPYMVITKSRCSCSIPLRQLEIGQFASLGILVGIVFSGYYIYIETSSPRVAFDFADLFSPLMSPPSRPSGSALSCSVRFCYHMYGQTVGTLSVYFQNSDGMQPIWHLHGNQGDRWLCDQVPLDQYIQNINYKVNKQICEPEHILARTLYV